MRYAHPAALLLVIATMPGCRPPTRAPDDVTVADSAGITIVRTERLPEPESAELAWSTVPGGTREPWHVSALTAIGPAGFAVADEDLGRVAVFDASGAEQWRAGRPGEGPGEFRGWLSIAGHGDSLYVFEFDSRRLTILHGGTVREIRREPLDPQNLQLLGVLADGEVALRSRNLRPQPGTVTEDSVTVFLEDSAGAVLRPVTWGHETSVFLAMTAFGPYLADVPFGPVGSFAIFSTGIARSDGATSEVKVHDLTGMLRRVVRWRDSLRAITDTDRVAERERQVTAIYGSQALNALEAWFDQVAFPEHWPAVGRVLASADGRLLIERHCLPSAGPCDWLATDHDGRITHRWRIPRHAEAAAWLGDLLVTSTGQPDGTSVVEGWRVGT